MAFSVKDFIFGGKTFCFCLPVRFGVVLVSLLSVLLSGTLTVVLWFEVAHASVNLSAYQKRVFVVAGLVETLLLAASVFGFVGAVIRKQLFVTIYAYLLYGHFVLNLGVATYFLWMVTHATERDIGEACHGAIQNSQAQAQCTNLFKFTEGTFIGVAAFVLLVELYCAIIVTRYVNQLRTEKRESRASRALSRDSGFKLHSMKSVYSPIHDAYDNAPGDPWQSNDPYDPYDPHHSI